MIAPSKTKKRSGNQMASSVGTVSRVDEDPGWGYLVYRVREANQPQLVAVRASTPGSPDGQPQPLALRAPWSSSSESKSVSQSISINSTSCLHHALDRKPLYDKQRRGLCKIAPLLR